jgi:hypothetical protein
MNHQVWIYPIHSRSPYLVSTVTHLEISEQSQLHRVVRLAQAWFDACPEPALEVQTFAVNLSLLEQNDGARVPVGWCKARSASLEESSEPVVRAYLHLRRQQAWFEVSIRGYDTLETVVFLPKLLLEFEPSEPQSATGEAVTTVTAALELNIRHEGIFSEQALEELLTNLDFALNQQRDSSSLAPESLDGVTEHFLFQILDVRRRP